MDLFLVFGIIMGALAVVVGMIVKGANVAVLLNPAAAIIIIVGTTAAVMNSFPRKEFLNIPRIISALFRERKGPSATDIILQISGLSQLARREGILALESESEKMEPGFLKKGLGLIVDGVSSELMEEMLEMEIESMEERHRLGASVFSSAGSYAPTLGVLGAVIGLIGALGNLNDTEKLGHMIAAAFVATLYGIFIGYVLCHPIASRLKSKSNEEIRYMRIIAEGVLSIQAGESADTIKAKLGAFLPEVEREKLNDTAAPSAS